MPRPELLLYKNSEISYSIFGRGKKPVVCFHGYGENSNSFSFLKNYAGEEFCFLAIDLPRHGKTNWREKDFTQHDLLTVTNHVLAASGFAANAKCILMGFSLGGRMALTVYQSMPSSFDRLVLLAPDGLKINFWYWLSTQTVLGRGLFSFTMKNPGWFFGFLKTLNAVGLVNRSIFKFVNFYIGDAKVRQELYDRWVILRKIKPDLQAIRQLIMQNHTQARLIYGKHDRIILPNAGQRFCTGIESNCRISIIHSGHQVLHENHVAEILPSLVD